ncbi:AP-1-like transcription factor YAP1 [Yarrowia sp. C11]|nr:AP-1-like transcription factor YAP1 [Yarrowia sp. C11]KAG5364938.1 AP-1-like transcription factor YAP1 [Yarrowia sp. E02]
MYSDYNVPGAMPSSMEMPQFKQEFDYAQYDLSQQPMPPQHQHQQQHSIDLSGGPLPVVSDYSSSSYTLDHDSQKRKMSPGESTSDGGADDESPEGDDGEADPKKPRKPGRKPETTIPASKRKAQNRAAQRAFRERKEKHLRDLETKISQLEGETAAKDSENEFLRFQVQRLQNELKLYREKPAGAPGAAAGGAASAVQSAPIPEMSAKPFTFEFPSYTPPKASDLEREAREQLQREQIRGYLQRKPSSVASDTTSPASQTSCNQSPCTNPSTYTSPQSQSSVSHKPLVGATMAAMNGKPDPHAVDFCAELSKACVNKAELLQRSATASASPSASGGQQSAGQPSVSTPVSTSTAPPLSASVATASSDLPGSDFLFDMPFDMDFMSYRDPVSETAHMDDFSLPELTTETSMFDPLDPHANNDVVSGKPLTTMSATHSGVNNGQGSKAKEIKKEEEEDLLMISKPKALMNCTAVWDRITSHPKFGDIDIEGLCSELRNKAKCSESGVVLTELDVDGVLSTFQ